MNTNFNNVFIKIFSICFLSILSFSINTSFALAMTGTGTEEDPYIIMDVNDLQDMNLDLNGYYELGTDIDASNTKNWNSGAGFEPIGADADELHFRGSIDGKNHIIHDLYIYRPTLNDVGFIGYSSWESDYIKNIGLKNVNFTGDYRTGGLGARIDTPVSNSWVTGQVTGSAGNSVAAGFIGQSHDPVSNCYANVDVYSEYEAAGFISFNNGEILNCFSTGSVEHSDRSAAFIVDADGHGGGEVDNSFFDNQSSTFTDGCYTDCLTAGITGKTTSDMTELSTFTDTSIVGLTEAWDFVNNPNDDISNNDFWELIDYPVLANFNYGGLITQLDTNLDVLDSTNGNNLQFGEGTPINSSTVNARILRSNIIISDIEIDLTNNRAWSEITAFTDTTSGVSVINGLTTSPGTASTHTLYTPIPTDNRGDGIRICPNATSLEDVSTDCENGVDFSEGETKMIGINSVSVSKITIESITYWKAVGVSGTGGISFDTPEIVEIIEEDDNNLENTTTDDTDEETSESSYTYSYISEIETQDSDTEETDPISQEKDIIEKTTNIDSQEVEKNNLFLWLIPIFLIIPIILILSVRKK